jgi:hypothetical protein
MREAWEYIAERWDASDGMFREQIVAAVIVGAVGLAFAVLQAVCARQINSEKRGLDARD